MTTRQTAAALADDSAPAQWQFRVPPAPARLPRGGWPTFSIVIPAYQSAHSVPAAVRSALAQTYPAHEIIVCDDGSTDDLAGALAGFGDRVTLLRRPHRGAGAARNAAIDAASGEFVVMLDADDVYEPDRLKALAALADERPDLDILTTDTYFESNGRVTGRFFQSNAFEIEDQRRVIVERCFFGWAAMRRRRVLAVGGFDESATIAPAEDWDLFLRLILDGARAGLVDHPLMRYRRHSASATANRSRTLWSRVAVLEKAKSRTDLSADERRHLEQFLAQKRERARRESPSSGLRALPRRVLPAPVFSWVRARVVQVRTAASRRRTRFGSLRRLAPISPAFGKNRGLPIDRHYIEQFLAAHAGDIRGRVLEIGDNRYTRRFGGANVTTSDVLHVNEDNPRATIVADLTRAEHVPSGTFDCIVLTQTLQFIFDPRAAVATLHRILKPGGVVLATVGGISQISRWDMDRWGHYWNFTSLSMQRLFEDCFPATGISVQTYGNVLAATAFLHGLASEELRPRELEHRDRDYEVLIALRAVK